MHYSQTDKNEQSQWLCQCLKSMHKHWVREQRKNHNNTIQKSDARIIFLKCFKLTLSLDFILDWQMICDQISRCFRNSFYVHVFYRKKNAIERAFAVCHSLAIQKKPIAFECEKRIWFYYDDTLWISIKNSIDSKSITQNSRTLTHKSISIFMRNR